MGYGKEIKAKKMDYKKLIEHYRSIANRLESGEQLPLNGELRLQDALRDAATTIETLLSKYKNLVDAVETQDCEYCKYNDYCEYNDYYVGHPICTECLFGELGSRFELDDKYKI